MLLMAYHALMIHFVHYANCHPHHKGVYFCPFLPIPKHIGMIGVPIFK